MISLGPRECIRFGDGCFFFVTLALSEAPEDEKGLKMKICLWTEGGESL